MDPLLLNNENALLANPLGQPQPPAQHRDPQRFPNNPPPPRPRVARQRFRRNLNELYAYDRQALTQGRFKEQRRRICGQITMSVFQGIIMFGFLFLLIYFQVGQDPISPLYLAEFLWFVMFIFTIFVMQIILLVSGTLALVNPKVLLDRKWQRKWNDLFLSYIFVFLGLYVLVGFVDLLQYPLLLTGVKFRIYEESKPEETPEEGVILLLGRIYQVIGLLLTVILSAALFFAWKKGRKEIVASRGALKLLDGKNIKTRWSSIQKMKPDDPRKADVEECAICLADFQGKDEVVQLTCHHNHIFHFKCLKQFLENVRDQRIGKAKCPMCQTEIQVRNWRK